MISLAAFFLVRSLVTAILVPQLLDINMGDAYCVLQFSENYFVDKFLVKSAIAPEIVLVVCHYPPFNSFVSKCCSWKQTHFIIMMKTKNTLENKRQYEKSN